MSENKSELLSDKMQTSDSFKVPEKITFQLPKSKKPEISKTFLQTSARVDSSKTSETKSDVPSVDHVNKTEDDNPQNIDNTDLDVNKKKKQNNESSTSSSKPLNLKIDSKYDFPAQQLSQGTIPYKEPPWGGSCDEQYKFEVLKNGVIADNVDLTTKSFHVLGRLPSCDITLEHPSLSRYHAVIQFCSQQTEKHECGWYLYDLDSTHGTWINKMRIKPKVYHRLRVGHMIKFGGSTRLFILQGPSTDAEEESELTVTEIKEQRERQKNEVQVLRLAEMEELERKAAEEAKSRELSGCSWGMDEADVVEEVTTVNPFSLLENEDLYMDDPKKSLKGFFEREGYDPPEYEVEEAGFGKYKCHVELPIDTPMGQPMIAEVVVSGKKKDAVVECALEACRILDRHGMLRNATHESRKRKQKNWEAEDFYDSDEDTFLDRTGDIEKKRSVRMKKAGKLDNKAQTYDSLMFQHNEVTKELEEIQAKLDKAKRDAAAAEAEDVDALDAYMLAIKSGSMDTKTKMKLKCRQLELKKEELRLRRLINIAKPASLPELNKSLPVKATPEQKVLPLIGKRKNVEHKPKIALPMPTQNTDTSEDFVEEEDEEDMETEHKNTKALDDSKPESSTSRQTKISHVTSQESKLTNRPGEMTNNQVEIISNQGETISNQRETNHTPVTSTQRSPETIENIDQSIKDQSLDDEKITPPVIKKKKRTVEKAEKITVEKAEVTDYDNTDPDFAVWVPPAGQTGDGKTSLNEKYGY